MQLFPLKYLHFLINLCITNLLKLQEREQSGLIEIFLVVRKAMLNFFLTCVMEWKNFVVMLAAQIFEKIVILGRNSRLRLWFHNWNLI